MKHTHVILVIALTLLLAVGTASAVTGNPGCDFTATPTTGVNVVNVTFSGQAYNMSSPFSYHWDFGDGHGAEVTSVSTISPATHTYLEPGRYTVSLAVYDLGIPTTRWVSNTKTDYIVVAHPAPTVDFTFIPDPMGNTPFTVTFDSTVTGGFEPTLSWDFDDGSFSDVADPTHVFYNTEETYTIINRTVTLTATNSDGESASKSALIRVRPLAPESAISADPMKGVKPLAVQFTDETVGFVTLRDWAFGDGTHSSETNPLHAYANAGIYEVVLTASSPSGVDQSNLLYINVTAVADPIVCPTPEPTPVPTETPTIPIGYNAPVVGVYKDGTWYNDYNGNGMWDVIEPVKSFGAAGWIPVMGNWNNAIAGDEVGIYKDGQWYIDASGDGLWTPGTDKVYSFGAPTWQPIKGDWNADGTDEIGVYKEGYWYLDFTGNGAWDAGLDKGFQFGSSGWEPIVTGK